MMNEFRHSFFTTQIFINLFIKVNDFILQNSTKWVILILSMIDSV